MRHVLILALAACTTAPTTDAPDTADTSGSAVDPTGDTGATTTAFTLAFDAKVGSEDAACGQSYDDLGTTDTTWVLADLRAYVHGVVFLTDDGTEAPATLDVVSPWQDGTTALLDFEDATGACADFGTAATRDVITGTVPEGSYTGVRFQLGVPFEDNHTSTATAEPPLDVSGMFWVWKGGRKFLRIDLVDGGTPATGWNVHLGSGGCQSADPMTPPTTPCSKPNVPTVTLQDFDVATDTVVLDIAALLDGVDLGSDTMVSPPGCMSNPADGAECDDLYPALGLDRATGACTDGCDDQTFVSFE